MEAHGEHGRNRYARRFVAGGLVLATALVGTMARGKGNGTVIRPVPGMTRFSAPPAGPVTFSGTLDRTTVLRGADGLVRMELVIGAPQQPDRHVARVPTDLMVILDHSGSMGGEKLDQARAAIGALVAQLGPQDRFGLVIYSNDATLTIPLATADAAARDRWLTMVAVIPADGGTNMSSGLDLGLDTLERTRSAGRAQRAILLSDGLANQGDASHDGLVSRATRVGRAEYMLTTVGIGADFNEYLMTALADAGTGNYYYLKAGNDLATVFAREFDAARTTVASGLAVRIEPTSGVRVAEAAGYPLEPAPGGSPGAVIFRPGALFAGQERRIWVTLAVPSQTVGDVDLGRFMLSYGNGSEPTTLAFADVPRVACVQSADDFYAGVDVPSWSRSVVVDAYNSMQEEVARQVKAGRRDEALKAIGEFRAAAAPMNARLKSAPVATQLGAADKLEADVGAAFNGPNQAAKQNDLSKERSAAALDDRRPGSKR